MKETTVLQPEVESMPMSELWYQKEEAAVTKRIITALNESAEVAAAAKAWQVAKEAQIRITRELKEMRVRHDEITAEIEDLKRSFGAVDSFADLKKIEGFQAEMKALDEVMPVMEQRLRFDSPASRELERLESMACHWIVLELKKICPELKENIDRKVEDLRRAVVAYHTVAERVRIEQKIVPPALLRWADVNKIIPEITGLDDLVRPSLVHTIGTMLRGQAIGKAQAEQAAQAAAAQAPPVTRVEYVSGRR